MYINSCIPWVSDEKKFTNLLSLAYRLGYQAVIVNFNSLESLKDFQKSKWVNREIHDIKYPINVKSIADLRNLDQNISLIPRLTINTQNPNELKQILNKSIQFKPLISIESKNQQVLEVAARDGRVDLLGLPDTSYIKNLTKGIISLAKQNNCFLDLNFSQIINADSYHRTRILRSFYRILIDYPVHTHKFSIGFYSELIENPFLLRGPTEITAILHTVFNIPLIHAKQIVLNNGEELALRYIKRYYDLFIEPGVELIKIKDNVLNKNGD